MTASSWTRPEVSVNLARSPHDHQERRSLSITSDPQHQRRHAEMPHIRWQASAVSAPMATKVQASPSPGFCSGLTFLVLTRTRPDLYLNVLAGSARPGVVSVHSLGPGFPPVARPRGFSRKPPAFPCSVRRGLPCRRAGAYSRSTLRLAIAGVRGIRCHGCRELRLAGSGPARRSSPWQPVLTGWQQRRRWQRLGGVPSRPARTRSAGSHGGAGIGVRSGLVRIAKHIQPSGEDTATSHPAAAAPPLAW